MSGIVATALVVCVSTACSSTDVAAVEVRRAPAVDPGADPFTDSVQVGPVPTIAAVATQAAATQRDRLDVDAGLGVPVAPGGDPGLFGGSPGTTVCDPDQLVTLLTGDTEKAAAWSGTLGVESDEIAGFVATLTPVVLMSDTLVTNHTYRDGKVSEVQSVLEAGTAVLVAAVGVPQVKCNSGNPLTRPAAIDTDATTFVGDEWDGFDPDEVIAVEPGEPIDTFSVIDVGTGTRFDVPAGGGVLPPPEGIDGTWTVSADATAANPACLGGATIVINGTTATMSRSGVATVSGAVEGGTAATAGIAASLDVFVIHLGGQLSDEIQLVLQIVGADHLLASISPDCDEFVNLTRTGAATTPVPVTTSATTTVPAPTPTTTTVPAVIVPTVPPVPVAPALSTVCARSNIDFAALRAEPSVDATLLAEIPPGSCDLGLLDTNEVGRNGINWYHVLWQGIEGWTASSNTTRVVTAPPVSALSGPPTDWTVDTTSGAACPSPDVTPQDGWWAGFTDAGGGVVELSGSPIQFSLRCDPQETLRTMERAPGAPVGCVNYGSYASVPCPAALQYMFLWVRIEGGVVEELVGAYVGG